MSVHAATPKKITTHTLQEMKHAGQKISMLTAYDYSMARIVDEAGIDVIVAQLSQRFAVALPECLEHHLIGALCPIQKSGDVEPWIGRGDFAQAGFQGARDVLSRPHRGEGEQQR